MRDPDTWADACLAASYLAREKTARCLLLATALIPQIVRAVGFEALSAHSARRGRSLFPNSETACSKNRTSGRHGGGWRTLVADPALFRGSAHCPQDLLFSVRSCRKRSGPARSFDAAALAGIQKQRFKRVDADKVERVWHGTRNTVDTCVNCTVSRPHNEPTRAQRNTGLASDMLPVVHSANVQTLSCHDARVAPSCEPAHATASPELDICDHDF